MKVLNLGLRGVLLGVLLGGAVTAAHAQPQKKQVEIKAQGQADIGAPETKSGLSAKEKGPKYNREQDLRGGKSGDAVSEAKFKEQLRLLDKLIASTSDQDPTKADLYDRKSELFWQRSFDLGIRAFDREEECRKKLGPSPSAAQTAPCENERKRIQAESERYREQAIGVYKEIVRNFPNYPRLDSVLFALAYNFQQKGELEGAKKIYVELVKRYPRSVHIADTLTNIGEIYFDAGDVDQAQKAYLKVVSNYKEAETYGYAMYKLGWCYFNQGDFKQALAQFLAVVKHANEATGRGARNRIGLKKEAMRDMVRAYVNIEDANPNQAIGFFRKHAPDDYMQLSENLAELYSLTGQFEKSNRLYRDLIAQQASSYKAVSFQRMIAFNTRAVSRDSVEIVREVKRLVDLWKKVKDAKDADPKRVAADREGFEELLRTLSVTMHLQWTKTKNPDDYAVAYEMYKDYVETFPEGANAYMLQFYQAELLYAGQKWEEAARAYERTLQLNGKGEHTEDSAQGAVLAYKKLIDIKQDRGKGGIDDVESNASTEGVPAAKPLPETHVRFIKACDLYVKFVKSSEYLVDIEYDAARIYYDFNQFDEAVPRFKNISEKHPEHRLAIFAANLLLDTYNLKGQMDDLDKQVDSYLKIYTPQRDPEFFGLLMKLKQQSAFKKCQGIERGKEWVRAATCFKQYAAAYPQSEYLDKAFFNAALNYEREKLLDQSIEMKLKIVNEVPQSELVSKALYQTAGNVHALAIYSQAAKLYEVFAEKFPKDANARDALRNATVFRQGLGEYDQALTDAANYMKLIGSKPDETAEVHFTMGLIYEKQEKWDEVIRHFNDFLRKYAAAGRADLRLEAPVRIGNAYEKKKDLASAQKAYATAFAAFGKLSDAEKGALTTGLNAVAEARFKMGEAIRAEFDSLKMKVSTRNVKKFQEDFKAIVTAKTDLIAKATAVYNEVLLLKSPNWALAALARIGQMYQKLANDVYDFPTPQGWDEEQVEVFKGYLATMAQGPESKAIDSYVVCVKKAQELRWFNEWSDISARQLAVLRPKEYRYDGEVRSKPDHFGSTTFRQPFIATLPTSEEQ